MDHSRQQERHLLEKRDDETESLDSFGIGKSEKNAAPRYLDGVSSNWRKSRIAILIHLCLILGYTIVSVAVIWQMKKKYSHGPDLIYSPAKESVRYEAKHFALLKGNTNFTGPFSGVPTPEIDSNWESLVKNLDFRITDDELEQLGGLRDPVKLPDGGYLANLNVHHELHCLMRLRWNLYPEFYFPNADAEKLQHNIEHSEHCIDLLRYASMCRSDTTLLPYQWINSARTPVLNFGRAHECVNFNDVDEWAGRRSVDVAPPGYLMHPTLGPSYPPGHPPAMHTYIYPNATDL